MSGVQLKRLLVALNRIKQHGIYIRNFQKPKDFLYFTFEGYVPVCRQSTAAQPKKEPEKVEVFVDGKAVQVEPNTTVLQVILSINSREREIYRNLFF